MGKRGFVASEASTGDRSGGLAAGKGGAKAAGWKRNGYDEGHEL